MNTKEKSDKLFDILNKGKFIKTEKNISGLNLTQPFEFEISHIENEKTMKFKDLIEATNLICEFAGIENKNKIEKQILNIIPKNSESNEFILKFLVLE